MSYRAHAPLVRLKFQVQRYGRGDDYYPKWPLVFGTVATAVVLVLIATTVLTSVFALMLVVIAITMTAAIHLVYVPRLARRMGLGPWTMGFALLAVLVALGYTVGPGIRGAAISVFIWGVIFAAPRLILTFALRHLDAHEPRE